MILVRIDAPKDTFYALGDDLESAKVAVRKVYDRAFQHQSDGWCWDMHIRERGCDPVEYGGCWFEIEVGGGFIT